MNAFVGMNKMNDPVFIVNVNVLLVNMKVIECS